MGKIKTVVMGDIAAEEKAREKAEAKRAQKKAEKEKTKTEKAIKKESLKTDTTDVLARPVPGEAGDTESLTSGKLDQEVKESRIPDQESPSSEIQEVKEVKKPKKHKIDNRYLFPSGKKYAAARSLVDPKKLYPVTQAIDLVKKTSYSTFDGSVEVHLNVTDKGLRGSVVLPHGTGKQVRVKIADEGLIKSLESGDKIDFDILVAEPSMMPKLAKVAKILGPRGLMPNPKTGTIGENVEELALRLGSGQQSWKTQPDFPIVHAVIGKVSFEEKKLEENLAALLKSIGKDKIKSVFLKATMGPSIKVQI